MPSYLYIIILVYEFLLGYYMIYKRHSSFLFRSTIKMSMSTLFFAVGVIALITVGFSLDSLLVLLALAAAWLGDFFLRYLGSDQRKFNLGVAFFGACQLLLCVAIVLRLPQLYSRRFLLIIPVCLSCALAATLLLWFVITKMRGLGSSRIYINAYVFTMSLLLALSLAFTVVSKSYLSILFGVGVVFFVVSDLFLGVYSFFKKKRVLTVISSLLYFTGMLLISLSLF